LRLNGDFLRDLPIWKHIVGCELSLVAVKWGKTGDGGGPVYQQRERQRDGGQEVKEGAFYR
jgi:hypothetical protein